MFVYRIDKLRLVRSGQILDILKAHLTGFIDELDMGYERKEPRMTSRCMT